MKQYLTYLSETSCQLKSTGQANISLSKPFNFLCPVKKIIELK